MKIREKLWHFAHSLMRDKYGFSILVISIVFSILFTVYSFLQFDLLNMSAWDLGIYTQALYSGIHGHLFYTSLLPGSYLSEHFSPILFLLVIPYYIYPPCLHTSYYPGICYRAFCICSLPAFP